MKEAMKRGDALIVVDVQKDFCPGGALAVPGGDAVVPLLNRCIRRAVNRSIPIFATRDWHPKNHVSFRERGGPWPPHCVQNTAGSEFHPDLKLTKETVVISKGSNPEQEAYSGFQGTDLDSRLRDLKIKRLFVGGLATDYCVKNTVLDALKLGFEVMLLVDAIRGVDAKIGDSRRAVEEMVARGARLVSVDEIL